MNDVVILLSFFDLSVTNKYLNFQEGFAGPQTQLNDMILHHQTILLSIRNIPLLTS